MTYAGIRKSLRNSYLISSRYGFMSVPRQRDECFLEVGAGDFEVGERWIAGDERAHDGVAVGRGDLDGAVVPVRADDVGHGRDVAEVDRRRAADLPPRRPRFDRLGRPLGYGAPAIDDDDAVAQRVRLGQVVRRQQ